MPGGRVHFGELRTAAARRKLEEECGLQSCGVPIELSTQDLILPTSRGEHSHSICTVFRVDMNSTAQITLDEQSEAAEWRTIEEWSATQLHPYVLKLFDLLQQALPSRNDR